ncbi:hypothetical protein [Hymenobacter properus]|uniref:Uncharacterized protein n=1 Tax=Hymenobacter properus TaxID=2791026 RepID=A0A931BKC3_9BACT|nr:hypothetical protein [Hymenobacter properus]MBF9144156.1 hypothetical protein [Hymenobacter properus]MBR7722972.1 hypothetical protein [Microvirga sp. SRT04]
MSISLNIMYKGKPTAGIEFYDLLVQSDEFTAELGKVALASGKLEAELILYLMRSNINGDFNKVTLGGLINAAEKNGLIDNNLTIALRQVSKQRNYITHNIYALFIDLLDETILEKANLLDSDVHTYLERALQLKENLNSLADIIRQKK